MNKKLIVVIALSSVVFAARSQGTSVGIKVGLNLAKESASNQGVNIVTDTKADFMAGLVFTNMFNGKVGLQEEILYSGQGGQVTAGSQTFKDKFSYINIPILLRVQLTPVFNLHAGPQIGFLLSAKEDDGSGSGYQDIKSQLKSTDFGIAFGGGIDIPHGPSLGIRYIDGLSNINADAGSGTVKNKVIQFSIGFKISKK